VDAKCREFYYANSSLEKTGKSLGDVGVKRVERMSFRDVVQNLQQLTLASPLYGIYQNPDVGKVAPAVLPLEAFYWQKPNEPLDLSRMPS
jgi:hypothetical protein